MMGINHINITRMIKNNSTDLKYVLVNKWWRGPSTDPWGAPSQKIKKSNNKTLVYRW